MQYARACVRMWVWALRRVTARRSNDGAFKTYVGEAAVSAVILTCVRDCIGLSRPVGAPAPTHCRSKGSRIE